MLRNYGGWLKCGSLDLRVADPTLVSAAYHYNDAADGDDISVSWASSERAFHTNVCQAPEAISAAFEVLIVSMVFGVFGVF